MIPVALGNQPVGSLIDPWIVQAFRKIEVASRQYTYPNVLLLPGPVPAPPRVAGSWVIFSDVTDGNMLKAIASTGVIVELGIP